VFAPKTNLAPANGKASRSIRRMSIANLRMAGLTDRGQRLGGRCGVAVVANDDPASNKGRFRSPSPPHMLLNQQIWYAARNPKERKQVTLKTVHSRLV